MKKELNTFYTGAPTRAWPLAESGWVRDTNRTKRRAAHQAAPEAIPDAILFRVAATTEDWQPAGLND